MVFSQPMREVLIFSYKISRPTDITPQRIVSACFGSLMAARVTLIERHLMALLGQIPDTVHRPPAMLLDISSIQLPEDRNTASLTVVPKRTGILAMPATTMLVVHSIA